MFKKQYKYIIRNNVLEEGGFYLFKPFINFKNFYYLLKPHTFFNEYCIYGKHGVTLSLFNIKKVFSNFIFFQNICLFFCILKLKLGFLKYSQYFIKNFKYKSLFFTIYGINNNLLHSGSSLVSCINIVKGLNLELFEKLFMPNLLAALLAISKLKLSGKGLLLLYLDSIIYSFLNIDSRFASYNVYVNLSFLIYTGFILFSILAFSGIICINLMSKLFLFNLKKKQVSYFKLKLGLFGFIKNVFF